MLNYPNYSANYNNYQQNQMPMYMQNPYQERINQLQAYQQTLNPTPMQNQFSALGKMVENIEMVKTTDIPMDGNMYYFPTADGNLIFGKQWLPTGQTRILTFKPILEDEPNNSPSDDIKTQFGAFGEVLGAIQSDIRMLFDKVDKISKPEKAKKGGSDE